VQLIDRSARRCLVTCQRSHIAFKRYFKKRRVVPEVYAKEERFGHLYKLLCREERRQITSLFIDCLTRNVKYSTLQSSNLFISSFILPLACLQSTSTSTARSVSILRPIVSTMSDRTMYVPLQFPSTRKLGLTRHQDNSSSPSATTNQHLPLPQTATSSTSANQPPNQTTPNTPKRSLRNQETPLSRPLDQGVSASGISVRILM
jgi:hypothetical protein